MIRTISAAGLTLLLLIVAGCGPTTPEGWYAQRAKDLNRLADVLESDSDKATVQAAIDKVKYTQEQISGLKIPIEDKIKLVRGSLQADNDAMQRVMKASAARALKNFDLTIQAEIGRMFGEMTKALGQ